MARPPSCVGSRMSVHKLASMSARRSTEWEAMLVDVGWNAVYANGGSGESTRTAQLAGATPQTLRGAIPRGRTSSGAHDRKVVRRRVAAQRLQRMGRKVHSQQSRQIPSLFVSIVVLDADDVGAVGS